MGNRLRRRWAISTGWKAARNRRVLRRPTRRRQHFRSELPYHVVRSPAGVRHGLCWTRSHPAARSFLQRMRGTTPFRYRDRTCARARGGVRWGSMVNALGFHGTCYRVIGHLRARHVLGKTPLLDEVTRASRERESTSRFWPNQQKPSNKCFRRKALPNIDLGLAVDGIVGDFPTEGE